MLRVLLKFLSCFTETGVFLSHVKLNESFCLCLENTAGSRSLLHCNVFLSYFHLHLYFLLSCIQHDEWGKPSALSLQCILGLVA